MGGRICRYCGGWSTGMEMHEENCVMRPEPKLEPGYNTATPAWYYEKKIADLKRQLAEAKADNEKSKIDALLSDLTSCRNECLRAKEDLLPMADPDGNARIAYGVVADHLTALIKRHGG